MRLPPDTEVNNHPATSNRYSAMVLPSSLKNWLTICSKFISPKVAEFVQNYFGRSLMSKLVSAKDFLLSAEYGCEIAAL